MKRCKITDTERLDWLESKAWNYGGGWIARHSTTGRGFRLHETSGKGELVKPTAREAIDAAIEEERTALRKTTALASLLRKSTGHK